MIKPLILSLLITVAGLGIMQVDQVCRVDYPQYSSLGEFTVYHYCSCIKCCGKDNGITATGTKAQEGRTIAVDPKVIPLGSKVVIDGYTYIAEDVGGGIKGNTIDRFVDSHSRALELGVQKKEVLLVK